MLKENEARLCKKKDWEPLPTHEPRYVDLMPHEISWAESKYKLCVLKILAYNDFEELVEAPCKDRSDIVEELLNKYK